MDMLLYVLCASILSALSGATCWNSIQRHRAGTALGHHYQWAMTSILFALASAYVAVAQALA